MRGALLVLIAGTAACASGTPGTPDAKQVGGADAPAGQIDAPAGTIDAAVDATIDAAPHIDAGVPDAMVDARPVDGGVLGNGDTCATANDISGQTSFTFSGDLTGLANDIEPNPSCTGYDNDGPDAVFIVTAAQGKTITASVTTTWDAAVEITTNCQLLAGCVAGQDGTAGGGTESTSYAVPTTGTYYVIVDSWDAAAYGPYSLTITIQ